MLGIPLLLYGIFKSPLDEWFAAGAGRLVKWIFIAGYAFLAVIFVVFGSMMAQAAKKAPDPDADAIIVLGAGIRGDKVTWTLKNRLDVARQYYLENPGAIIVVSGGYGKNEQHSEAFAMEKYLLEQGVAKSDILKEERSSTTAENFEFSKSLLDERLKPGYRVVYATNDFHILRAGIKARQAGIKAQGLAAPTPIYIVANSYMRESLALLSAFVLGT